MQMLMKIISESPYYRLIEELSLGMAEEIPISKPLMNAMYGGSVIEQWKGANMPNETGIKYEVHVELTENGITVTDKSWFDQLGEAQYRAQRAAKQPSVKSVTITEITRKIVQEIAIPPEPGIYGMEDVEPPHAELYWCLRSGSWMKWEPIRECWEGAIVFPHVYEKLIKLG